MRIRIALASAALLALSPTLAVAKDRYVTPAGSGSDCTQEKPCSIFIGVNSAAAKDVVHVAGDLGPYPVITSGISVNPGVVVVGEGAQLPQLTLGGNGEVGVGGGTLTRFDLRRTSATMPLLPLLRVSGGGMAQRLRIESTVNALPVEMLSGVLRDSFVRATAAGTPAVQPLNNSILRNVTALATGPSSAGIRTSGSGFPPSCAGAQIQLRNTIARGVAFDIEASGMVGCASTIDVGHSNFRAGALGLSNASVIDSGGNQTSVNPLFGADGLHQLAGSPTIDAGLAEEVNGPFDIDGDARLLGTAPDIGADEFPSPPLSPTPAADTTAPEGSALKLSPKRFVPGKRKPKGTSIGYSLTESALTTFTVQRKASGRRANGRRGLCLTGKAAKAKGGLRCIKLVKLGTLAHQGAAGANSFRFDGWVGGKKLPPGSYLMTGRPTDAAGNVGAAFGATFAVLRPRAKARR